MNWRPPSLNELNIIGVNSLRLGGLQFTLKILNKWPRDLLKPIEKKMDILSIKNIFIENLRQTRFRRLREINKQNSIILFYIQIGLEYLKASEPK